MIEVSYKDFTSNSGNIRLESVKDKLHELFLTDNEIKLKERDKIYSEIDINILTNDIINLLNKQRPNEENPSTFKICCGIYILVYLICLIFNIGYSDDFAAKYAKKHHVPRSEVFRIVNDDARFFPLPHRNFIIEYENGNDRKVGWSILGVIFITDKI